jgi:hypothetical protein
VGNSANGYMVSLSRLSSCVTDFRGEVSISLVQNLSQKRVEKIFGFILPQSELVQ